MSVSTEEARRDLDEILSYIAEDSINYALELVDELESAALDLGVAALHYPLAFGSEKVRRRPVGAYNIYYTVRGSTVEVVHVLHSARDADRILFPED